MLKNTIKFFFSKIFKYFQVALVFAAVVVGSHGFVIPLTYTGTPGAVVTSHKTYTVQPQIKSIAPIVVQTPTQYVAPIQQVVVAKPTQYVAAAPAPVAVASVSVPATPVQSQFHSQDELGAYHFGHSGGAISRQEIRDHAGNVQGSYNYIDPEGQVQTTHYTAGAEGFKVAATNLPVAPEVVVPALPTPVADTAEVAAAKSTFKAAFDKAVAATAAKATPAEEPVATPARKKRSVVAVQSTPIKNQFTTLIRNGFPFNTLPTTYTAGVVQPITTPLATTYTAGAVHPFTPLATTYTAGVVQPLTYTAQSAITPVRDAELLRVTNNPGHAVSYRVYQ